MALSGNKKNMSTRKHRNDRFLQVHGHKTNKSGQSVPVTRKDWAKEKKAKRALKKKSVSTKPEVIERRNKKAEIRKERMHQYHIRKAEAIRKKKEDARD